MIVYRAAWVCPIDLPPIQNGWVAVADGRIVDIGDAVPPVEARDLGLVALLPGLVNAHAHLELSWLRGRVPPADSFTEWIAGLFAARGGAENPGEPAVVAAATCAAHEARASGTAAVGDVANSLACSGTMAAARLHGLLFHELIGFAERDGGMVDRSRAPRDAARGRGVRVTVAPHAPYSVSPELFRAIRAAVDASDLPITSVHLGESPEEVELLARGTGTWPRLLKQLGAWRDDWTPPACAPVAYLDRLGMLDRRTLVVHGVQFDDASLARVAEIGATLVTCPRSNQWVGVGAPPIGRFYRSGVPVAVGTDSLASVADLNLFGELKTMRALAPEVSARRLLESATIVGARALGLDRELGSIRPGKVAELIAVELPETMHDVEGYLVSGIEPRQVSWPLTLNS